MDLTPQEQFENIYTEYIKRDGSQRLLDWIRKTDFYTAPASTRFHGAFPCGLVQHSLNVFDRLKKEYELEYGPDLSTEQLETVAVVALLHDICKANFYEVEMRNRKNKQGQWEQYPAYIVNDKLPYGHGEKSVYIISGFMRLSREETMAIRWHMGGFDDSSKGGSYSVGNAFEMFPLAVLSHIADLKATYFDESQDED